MTVGDPCLGDKSMHPPKGFQRGLLTTAILSRHLTIYDVVESALTSAQGHKRFCFVAVEKGARPFRLRVHEPTVAS